MFAESKAGWAIIISNTISQTQLIYNICYLKQKGEQNIFNRINIKKLINLYRNATFYSQISTPKQHFAFT